MLDTGNQHRWNCGLFCELRPSGDFTAHLGEFGRSRTGPKFSREAPTPSFATRGRHGSGSPGRQNREFQAGWWPRHPAWLKGVPAACGDSAADC